mmetsp:Transcript_69801/g.227039  ORF Transcript_69801/g.227039 Transcript_69801/m.227039 type:complete len:371 (-) Transcript_69801:312-1424(-)
MLDDVDADAEVFGPFEPLLVGEHEATVAGHACIPREERIEVQQVTSLPHQLASHQAFLHDFDFHRQRLVLVISATLKQLRTEVAELHGGQRVAPSPREALEPGAGDERVLDGDALGGGAGHELADYLRVDLEDKVLQHEGNLLIRWVRDDPLHCLDHWFVLSQHRTSRPPQVLRNSALPAVREQSHEGGQGLAWTPHSFPAFSRRLLDVAAGQQYTQLLQLLCVVLLWRGRRIDRGGAWRRSRRGRCWPACLLLGHPRMVTSWILGPLQAAAVVVVVRLRLTSQVLQPPVHVPVCRRLGIPAPLHLDARLRHAGGHVRRGGPEALLALWPDRAKGDRLPSKGATGRCTRRAMRVGPTLLGRARPQHVGGL